MDYLDPDELEALERRAQNAADQYVEETEDQIEQRRLNAFLLESERRIIEDSNKDLTRSTTGETRQLGRINILPLCKNNKYV